MQRVPARWPRLGARRGAVLGPRIARVPPAALVRQRATFSVAAAAADFATPPPSSASDAVASVVFTDADGDRCEFHRFAVSAAPGGDAPGGDAPSGDATATATRAAGAPHTMVVDEAGKRVEAVRFSPDVGMWYDQDGVGGVVLAAERESRGVAGAGWREDASLEKFAMSLRAVLGHRLYLDRSRPLSREEVFAIWGATTRAAVDKQTLLFATLRGTATDENESGAVRWELCSSLASGWIATEELPKHGMLNDQHSIDVFGRLLIEQMSTWTSVPSLGSAASEDHYRLPPDLPMWSHTVAEHFVGADHDAPTAAVLFGERNFAGRESQVLEVQRAVAAEVTNEMFRRRLFDAYKRAPEKYVPASFAAVAGAQFDALDKVFGEAASPHERLLRWARFRAECSVWSTFPGGQWGQLAQTISAAAGEPVQAA